jgi:repressor LexA
MTLTCPNCHTPWTPARPPLTAAQRRVLDAIRRHQGEHGVSPTHRELADATGVRSLATISGHLEALEAGGYVHREPMAARGITIVEGS